MYGDYMTEYDKEFLDYMKSRYHITLENATNGSEREIITFNIAWDIWKQAKSIYSKNE